MLKTGLADAIVSVAGDGADTVNISAVNAIPFAVALFVSGFDHGGDVVHVCSCVCVNEFAEADLNISLVNPMRKQLYITLHWIALNGLQAIIFFTLPYPLENVIHTTSACYPQTQVLYKT